MASPLPPPLLEHLTQSLSTFPGSHTFTVQVLRSQPRRSHALFPHASNLKTKVWQEEILVVLSEEVDIPEPEPSSVPPAEGATPSTEPPAAATTVAPASSPRRASVPVVGLEAAIYTIPSTSTSILYVSKVDTTGLSASRISPARTFVAAFLSYHLLHPPHATNRLRIHIFARAQGQYLFPGSVENKKKHVLDDKGLLRWWKASISLAVASTTLPTPAQLFYLVPGLSYLESLPYVPSSTPPAPQWTYGHPYSTMASPLHPADSTPSSAHLADHIPCFPDDPKSRFNTSLTSSAIASSGNENDYDDVMLSLQSAAFTTGSTSTSRVTEIERERERERKRLTEGVAGGVEEWWERMAFRQECCSGVLVGFFVVAREGVAAAATTDETTETTVKIKKDSAPTKVRMAVHNSVFTKLWSQFHNADYATTALPKLALVARKWEEDVERITRIDDGGEEGGDLTVSREGYEKEVRRRFTVDNPVLEQKKRDAEAPVVNKLAPRKKKPKV